MTGRQQWSGRSILGNVMSPSRDGAGDRHDPEVREMMRKALELAYSGGRGKEEAG